MNVQIQVLSVTVSTKQGKKPYQNAEVAYKDLTAGKVASKNITQYSAVFKTFAEAQPGQFYDVVSEKNGEYWEWTSATRNLSGSTPPTEDKQAVKTVGNTAPRSNYETPEERAKRQALIVRQSSVKEALARLSVGAKTPPDLAAVLSDAQVITNWVYETEDLFDQPNDLPENPEVD